VKRNVSFGLSPTLSAAEQGKKSLVDFFQHIAQRAKQLIDM